LRFRSRGRGPLKAGEGWLYCCSVYATQAPAIRGVQSHLEGRRLLRWSLVGPLIWYADARVCSILSSSCSLLQQQISCPTFRSRVDIPYVGGLLVLFVVVEVHASKKVIVHRPNLGASGSWRFESAAGRAVNANTAPPTSPLSSPAMASRLARSAVGM